MAKAKVCGTYSPMMQAYIDLKKDYEDYIVFYRLGDFYEMFFDDAKIASRELELALTGKDAGQEERVPMCGIPHHASDQYIEKLVRRGYKVAIVEQLEDPKKAVGIVKRGVVKIVTPGTMNQGLNDKENNYIGAITFYNKEYVLSYSDMSTGEGYVATYHAIDVLLNDIISLKIKEVLLKSDFTNSKIIEFLNKNEILISIEDNEIIPVQLENIVSLIDGSLRSGVGMLIEYFIKTQKTAPSFFKPFVLLKDNEYLHLDAFTKRNLELNETLRLNTKNGSLLSLLDKCNTAMGSRMMNKWMNKPLISKSLINKRLDAVSAFNDNLIIKEDVKSVFKNVYDLERIIGRISSGSANAKDLVWLRRSLENIPFVKESLSKMNNPIIDELNNEIDPHSDLNDLLQRSLVNDPPFLITEGGLIQDGFNKDLDEIRSISRNSKEFIMNYEKEEREVTGITTLKVGYNRVTGYYIEVTKGQLDKLDSERGYQRRQTLANAERFITPVLKKYEDTVLNAKERIESLEYQIFVSLRDEAKRYISSLQNLADIISTLDCFISLSDLAIKNNYVRPTFNDRKEVSLVDSRHPVLETIQKGAYIVNDCYINKYNMILITGPNMSGKSTYMKMIATIVILAQMGSFVPAKTADLMIFDSIFTRIGASDDLVSGQSTFMVEMVEANYAISNATQNSLLLFDEIGRGTATFDGMALAQSILEYIHEKIGCVCLFSTHYHELTQLEGKLKRLKNVHVEAEEENGKVRFLHKVIDGPTDKSYGINVASLAGLPKSLLKRSRDILDALEKDKASHNGVKLDLFNFTAYEEEPEVIMESKADLIKKRLDEIDPNKISPMDALKIIYELKEI